MSLQATNVCVVDGDNNVVQEATLETDPDAIELFLAKWGIHLKRVGLEAFSYSAWLFTALSEKGRAVICLESRHAKAALNAMLNKTDRNAKCIAQMMRTGWFRTVHVKSESAQPLRAPLVGRKAMRGKMLGMENMIRDLLRPFGLKVGEISVGRFDARVREIMAGKRESEAIVAPLFDARNAMRLQLTKLHRLPLVAARSDSAVRRMMTVGHRSAPLLARIRNRRVPFRGQDCACARIAGGRFGAAVNPRRQVFERIHNAAAQLPVRRACAIGAVLFEGATGQSEKARRLGRAQVSRRQAGVRIGHLRGSVVVWSATEFGRASTVTMTE